MKSTAKVIIDIIMGCNENCKDCIIREECEKIVYKDIISSTALPQDWREVMATPEEMDQSAERAQKDFIAKGLDDGGSIDRETLVTWMSEWCRSAGWKRIGYIITEKMSYIESL